MQQGRELPEVRNEPDVKPNHTQESPEGS
jgi:hypothetical protein